MAERRGQRRPGISGLVVIVALAAIAGAWLVTTFSSSIASAAQDTQERVERLMMSDEEEIEQAVRNYVEAYNYEGYSGKEFRKKVERTVVPSEYYSSPVGESFRGITESLDEADDTSLTRSTEFESWNLGEQTDDTATGTIGYQLKDVVGGEEVSRFGITSEIRLTRTDEGWKVTWEEKIEEQENSQETSEQTEAAEGSEGGG